MLQCKRNFIFFPPASRFGTCDWQNNGPQWWATLVAQMVKRLPTMRETWVRSLGQELPLEKEMATHSSILAWKLPWMEEPGRLQSMRLQRVGHDWATSLHFNDVHAWFFAWQRDLTEDHGRSQAPKSNNVNENIVFNIYISLQGHRLQTVPVSILEATYIIPLMTNIFLCVFILFQRQPSYFNHMRFM